MFLINNQPTIDFSSYVDTEQLLALKPYLDYAVVKSSQLATPSRYYREQFLDQTYLGISDVYKNTVDFEFYEDLKNTDQLAEWLRYQQNLVYGQQSVPIIYPIDWNTKHDPNEVVRTENVQYWSKFFNWLDSQNIFKQYGRVVVFLNEPGVSTPIHRDSADSTRRDEFIWITVDNRKQMFVYDPIQKMKYYLTSPIGTFDTTNYHGADASNLASWSLRIDGIFSDRFLDQTKLKNHYRL